MTVRLNVSEIRTLGALIEKRMTTPDHYPLTLNALVTACNQSSNRNPVVSYDAHTVNSALVHTREQGLSALSARSGARAHKFSEKLCESLGLGDRPSAILAELMLRGPQTPGELRQRASRMVDFPDLESVESTLEALALRQEPLVMQLPLQPGKREARYTHLLAGEPAIDIPHSMDSLKPEQRSTEPEDILDHPTLLSLAARVAQLEQQMAEVMKSLDRRS